MEGLIILYGLLVKHAIADLAIQSFRKTPGDKSDLRSLKGYIHAADHAGLTFVVIALLTNNALMSISIALLDYVLHFIIDYIKTRIIKRYKWTTDQKAYWVTQAIDQILHYTCYFSYILILTSI